MGQGGRSTSGSSTVIRLRSCLTMQSAVALELKLTTVTCPARFTNSSNFDSTDRDIDLLALGIRGRVIRLEAGGIIADGGCLPAQGH